MPGNFFAYVAAPGVKQNAVTPVQARFGALPPGPLTAAQPWRYGETMGAAVRDSWWTQTLRGETVVPARVGAEVLLGPVRGPSRYAHMKVDGFNPNGTVIGLAALNDFLTPAKIIVTADSIPIYDFSGLPTLGIVFYVALSGNEVIRVRIDTSDPRNTLNGQTLRFQLFVNSDPQFTQEMLRKGNPRT